MNDIVPIIASLAWLIVVGSALASFRLGWGKIARMALVWIAIFLGLYVAVEWALMASGTAGSA